MTTIAILGGDFEVLLADETTGTAGTNAGLRMVRRASGAGSTVYTTNQLYSAVAEVTDDFIAMGFKNPMLPVTPNAYTMENYYFIPRSSTEYLKEGAITADWTLAAPNSDSDGNGVIRIPYTLGTNFVAGDIGRQITDGTDQGTLLDFEIEPDGTRVAWVRPNDSTPVTGDLFDAGSGTLEVTTDGGTGTVTISAAGTSGITQFSAIQAIGSVPTATEVYVVQDRAKLADASTNTFQWWSTDTTVSLGIISILVRVRNSGTLIADGDVEVFARRYTSLYDNFRLNVSGGGFSALPLASAPDINNTTGYSNSGTLSSVTSTPTVGNAVYVGASWAAATAKGVVTAVNGSTDFDFYLIGDLTAIGSTTAVTGYSFTNSANDGFSATTGTIANTSGGPLDSASGQGGTVTVALGETLQDHDGDTNNEPYSLTVNCQSNVPIAKVYERLKYITRRGADASILFGAGTDVPGETYRGLQATLEFDASTGTMTDGDNITITGGDSGAKTNHSSRLLAHCDGYTTNHITLTDIQTSLTSAQPADNDVLDDETADDVTLHAGGTIGLRFLTSPKSAPFGTFTGSQIFGAPGVYYANPASSDTQAYILTDNLGDLNTPPNTVSFTVENTRDGDRILVARDTGTSGVINKDQFGGIATGTLGGTSITVTGSIDSEVPASGYVRVVSTAAGTGLLQEHRYRYSSRTAGASGVFTLTQPTTATGTITADGTPDADGIATLTDSSGDFQGASPVEIGDLVRITNNSKTTHVWEVTAVPSGTTLTVKQLYGPLDATQDLDDATPGPADTYEINRLIGNHTTPTNYSTNDNLYDLILDVEETTGTDGSPGSESNTFVQSTSFNVVVNVRQGKTILPFTQNAAIGSSGGSVTVVRQEDTIAS